MKREHHKLLLDIILWDLVFVLLGVSSILGWIVLPIVLIARAPSSLGSTTGPKKQGIRWSYLPPVDPNRFQHLYTSPAMLPPA